MKKQSGFTLVELAIVMIIIGLLIGGILKGQELVANARVTSSISQVKAIQGSVLTFKDKYDAMPGDIIQPNIRLPGCNNIPCNMGGNENGRIDGTNLSQAPALNNEAVTSFLHLSAGGLISGVDINGDLEFGGALPQADLGGGFWMAYERGGNFAGGGFAGGGLGIIPRAGHYTAFNGLLEDITEVSTSGISATYARMFDIKLDDGNANTGNVTATGNNCKNIQGVYTESDPSASCSLFIYMSN